MNSSAHVVQLFKSYETTEDYRLVYEDTNQDTMYAYLKGRQELRETTAAAMVLGVLRGLADCHAKGTACFLRTALPGVLFNP